MRGTCSGRNNIWSVEAFRNRPLDAGPYTYVMVDALGMKCREAGRIVMVAVVVATGVSAEGYREILGIDIITAEDGAGWTAFLRGLVARGLSGVALVTSDSHEGIKQAIAAVLPGASWQRCRTHFMRNLLTKVSKSMQEMVATLVRSIFAQPDAASTREQHRRVVEQLDEKLPDAARLLADAGPDLLAFTSFPKENWRLVWSNNPIERLNREIRRREVKRHHLCLQKGLGRLNCARRALVPGSIGANSPTESKSIRSFQFSRHPLLAYCHIAIRRAKTPAPDA